jgi:hypothetical protein
MPTKQPTTSGLKPVSRDEGVAILDRQARKYLHMSGDEFAQRYRAGTIEDPDRSEVLRVAMLLPLADKEQDNDG